MGGSLVTSGNPSASIEGISLIKLIRLESAEGLSPMVSAFRFWFNLAVVDRCHCRRVVGNQTVMGHSFTVRQ
jgi:hypothetical protein